MKEALSLLHAAGAKKVNFAGGEPFLFPDELAALLSHSKGLGLYTSVISNGSRITPSWMSSHSHTLDMLGLSFDSGSDDVNFSTGRWPIGTVRHSAKAVAREAGESKCGGPPLPARSTVHLLAAAQLAHQHGVELKVNTVVTALNAHELVSPIVDAANPSRWKVFQVLALEGENAGPGAIANVAPLQVSRATFDAYIARNSAALKRPEILIPEPNEVMRDSYILMDEKARFLDCSGGSKVPTRSILEVGVEGAAQDLLMSTSGTPGFNREAFLARGGDFFVPKDPQNNVCNV